MRDPTKTLMLGLIAISAFLGVCAYAACGSVYDPMTGQWVYACSQDPSPGSQPQCHNEYDAMNGKWVLVCH